MSADLDQPDHRRSVESDRTTAPGPVAPKIDLSHLLDQRVFRQLPNFTPPEPFRTTADKLDSYSLQQLVDNRFYIPAAVRAQKLLAELDLDLSADKSLSETKKDADQVFKLWHIRISSLLLARLGSIAREESRHLGDLGASRYRDGAGTSIVPWETRLLVIGLQASSDSQAALGRYYALAREAGAEVKRARGTQAGGGMPEDNTDETSGIAEAEDNPDDTSGMEADDNVVLWQNRLRELGLYVAAMLLGARDTITAIEHLNTLYHTAKAGSKQDQEFANRVSLSLALVYLRCGDTLSAREWLGMVPESQGREFTLAVCSVADSDWAEAELQLELAKSKTPKSAKLDAEIVNAIALTKLNEGKVSDSIDLLEGLATSGALHPTIMLNLFTLYDLQQEVSRQARSDLLKVVKDSGVESLGTYEVMRIGSH